MIEPNGKLFVKVTGYWGLVNLILAADDHKFNAESIGQNARYIYCLFLKVFDPGFCN